jgi:predicted transcriptional regulator
MPAWFTRWRDRRATSRAEAELAILNALHDKSHQQTLRMIAQVTGLPQHLIDGHIRDMIASGLVRSEMYEHASGRKYEVFVLSPVGRQTWETFNESDRRANPDAE